MNSFCDEERIILDVTDRQRELLNKLKIDANDTDSDVLIAGILLLSILREQQDRVVKDITYEELLKALQIRNDIIRCKDYPIKNDEDMGKCLQQNNTDLINYLKILINR